MKAWLAQLQHFSQVLLSQDRYEWPVSQLVTCGTVLVQQLGPSHYSHHSAGSLVVVSAVWHSGCTLCTAANSLYKDS